MKSKTLKMMKFQIAAILVTLFTAAGCQEKPEEEEKPVTVTMAIDKSTMDFDIDGGTQSAEVTCAVEPQVFTVVDWCHPSISGYSGTTHKATLKISVDKSEKESPRTVKLTVSGDKGSVYLTVTQNGMMSVSSSGIEFTSDGGSRTIKVSNCGKQPTVGSDCEWCSAVVSTSGEGTAEVTVTAQANVDASIRNATVSVISGVQKASVQVTQDAKYDQQDPLNVTIETAAVKEISVEETASTLGMGWNMGNHFDAHNNGVASETAWGNKKATQQTFDKVKAAGFTTVRIPVTWMGHIGEKPAYKLESQYLDRIYEVVGYAEKAGLNVILNIHHDGADSNWWLNIKKAAASETDRKTILYEFFDVWTQIAEKFKDKGDFLLFEPFNEIHDGGWGWGDNRSDGGKQYTILNEWNQAFVNAVRLTGGCNATRWLSVVGYSANPDMTMSYSVIPKDYTSANRLIVGVHFYDPYEYTLNCTYGEWGHTASAGKKASYGDEEYMTGLFDKLKKKYIDNGYPVYIGECGCSARNDSREILFRNYYMEYLFKAAREYGLVPIVWDNGSTGTGKECHGYFDHATGDFIGDAASTVAIMKKAIFSTDPSYTLQSVYDSAPAKE